MKLLFFILTIILSINAFSKVQPKTGKRKIKKVKIEDAKEQCLIKEGASISDELLDKCIKKLMNAKKTIH